MRKIRENKRNTSLFMFSFKIVCLRILAPLSNKKWRPNAEIKAANFMPVEPLS